MLHPSCQRCAPPRQPKAPESSLVLSSALPSGSSRLYTRWPQRNNSATTHSEIRAKPKRKPHAAKRGAHALCVLVFRSFPPLLCFCHAGLLRVSVGDCLLCKALDPKQTRVPSPSPVVSATGLAVVSQWFRSGFEEVSLWLRCGFALVSLWFRCGLLRFRCGLLRFRSGFAVVSLRVVFALVSL